MKIIQQAFHGAIGSHTRSRQTDGVMQAVDFCYPMNMSMIRSRSPPGTNSSCSAMDSCKGSDIFRLIPAGCCSLHPIVFYLYIHFPTLSWIIRQHVFRAPRLLCVDSVQIILIHLRKQCVSLSDEIMALVCSHILVTEEDVFAVGPWDGWRLHVLSFPKVTSLLLNVRPAIAEHQDKLTDLWTGFWWGGVGCHIFRDFNCAVVSVHAN